MELIRTWKYDQMTTKTPFSNSTVQFYEGLMSYSILGEREKGINNSERRMG